MFQMCASKCLLRKEIEFRHWMWDCGNDGHVRAEVMVTGHVEFGIGM